MKFKHIAFFTISMMIFSGCSVTAPKPSIEQYENDREYCSKVVWEETKDTFDPTLQFAFKRHDMLFDCMVEVKGWNRETLFKIESERAKKEEG